MFFLWGTFCWPSLQVILFLTHLKSLIPEAKTPCRDMPQVSSIYKRWMGMPMLAPFRHVSGCIFKNVWRDTFPRKPSISLRGLESHWCGRAGRERSRSSVMSSNKQARNCVNALIACNRQLVWCYAEMAGLCRMRDTCNMTYGFVSLDEQNFEHNFGD